MYIMDIHFNKVICEHCGEYLRVRKHEWKDFLERKLHLKCWKELGCPKFIKKISNNNISMDKKIDTNVMNNWKINFGKYKGETFESLLKDEKYCKWILQKEDFSNKALISYLEDKLP